MTKTYCPSCEAEIQIKKPEFGDIVHCPECDEELEIISVNPLEVDYPLEEEWDDDWDEWEEDDWKKDRGKNKKENDDEDEDWWD